MADFRFQVGDRVVARRERKMLMDVLDVAEAGKLHTLPMFQCRPCTEHAPLHRRGRSARWFREDDLNAA